MGKGGEARGGQGRGGEGKQGEGKFAPAPSKYIWIDATGDDDLTGALHDL